MKNTKEEKKIDTWEIVYGKRSYIFVGTKPKIKKVKISNHSSISYMVLDEAGDIGKTLILTKPSKRGGEQE
jgi:hypothetical protein